MDPDITTDLLDPRAFSTLIVPSSTHNLLRLSTHLLQRPRAHNLQQRRHTPNIDIFSRRASVFNDEDQLFEKCMRRFNQEAEGRDLGADRVVLDEGFAEGVALTGVVVGV